MKTAATNADLFRRYLPYFLIAPVLIYYLAFWLGPVLTAVVESFLTSKRALTFDNYLAVMKDSYFHRALLNTTIIVVISVTLEFIIAFVLALLINCRFKGAGIFLALAMIPMALPPVALGAMWSSGLAEYGWLNSLLVHVGLISADAPFAFLGGSEWRSMLVIILIDAWQVIPFMMIILLAGLQNISKEYQEAGAVFGATSWTVCWRITMPMMRSTIQTAMLLRIISAIQIWLIIVMIFGFRRLPVLLEEVMYYQDQLTGGEHYQIAMAYSVIVAIIVSVAAIIYLRLSSGKEKELSC